MRLEHIRQHWEKLAEEYGTDIRATTKTTTAKEIELHALTRVLEELPLDLSSPLKVVEAGCGNGLNLFWLCKKFPQLDFNGFDFVPQMIASAIQLRNEEGISAQKISFEVAEFNSPNLPVSTFDVVITVRGLINLNSDELQFSAVSKLASLLKPGGFLILLENSSQAHSVQNNLRERVELPARPEAKYNHFLNENAFRDYLKGSELEIWKQVDFIGLHDLLLYILVPMLNGGKIDYDNPLVHAAAELTKKLSLEEMSSLGPYGQNRLFVYQKKRQD